ncbi:restriction endonuclease fold toxin 5 domain-containing protein [Wielerella bovis]|uniref:restriction endonuclease fold toxin 5 domain-containing protein n=1 Tax=Wielerella bovis TaxID=2917790 RepID=UPI0020193078|nr:restriction endonuclease fold toxin 5 domain-containing protein [Wielerella bovis]ULJ64495.1 restriction endonuclease fold toxin 5 domain-containing protein [Wielerella bovis]ULJ66781.1 restriction endonuclease fold toxin 5 domain-containing protein [Wielerella bovis]
MAALAAFPPLLFGFIRVVTAASARQLTRYMTTKSAVVGGSTVLLGGSLAVNNSTKIQCSFTCNNYPYKGYQIAPIHNTVASPIFPVLTDADEWLKKITLTTAVAGTLDHIVENFKKHPCRDCSPVIMGKTHEATLGNTMVAAAMFQWIIASTLDIKNFGKYKFNVDFNTCKNNMKSNESINFQNIFGLREHFIKNDLALYKLRDKCQIKITEFKYLKPIDPKLQPPKGPAREVSFDGFWPSWCTFIEVKYGYNSDKEIDQTNESDFRSGWPRQLARQLDVIEQSNNRQNCDRGFLLRRENPLIWFFSNENAHKHFERVKEMVKNEVSEPNKNIAQYSQLYSVHFSDSNIKILTNLSK